VHERHLAVADDDRPRQETPCPRHLPTSHVDDGVIAGISRRGAEGAGAKHAVHGPVVLDVHVGLAVPVGSRYVHREPSLALDGDVARAKERRGRSRRLGGGVVVPLHDPPDDQRAQVEARRYDTDAAAPADDDHAQGDPERYDAYGVVSALRRDLGRGDDPPGRRGRYDGDVARRGRSVAAAVAVLAGVHLAREVGVGDCVGRGLHGVEIRCVCYSFRFVSFRFVVAEVDERGDNMSEREQELIIKGQFEGKSVHACNHAAHHRPVKSSRTKVRSLIRLTQRPIDDHDGVVTRDYEEGP